MRILSLIFIFGILSIEVSQAQEHASWKFGITTIYSFEKYRQTVTTLSVDVPNSTFENLVNSKSSFGAGIWTERKILEFLSIYSRANFHRVQLNEQLFENSIGKVGGGNPYREWHNSISVVLATRLQRPFSPYTRMFLDIGVMSDRLIKFRHRYAQADYSSWNPKSFNSIVPGWIAGAGIQYRNIILSAEYHNYWGDAITKKRIVYDKSMLLKRSINRGDFSLNLSFELWKSSSK